MSKGYHSITHDSMGFKEEHVDVKNRIIDITEINPVFTDISDEKRMFRDVVRKAAEKYGIPVKMFYSDGAYFSFTPLESEEYIEKIDDTIKNKAKEL